MKYWLLTTEYPPFFGGGIGTYCATTARMFAKEGHEVTVFVCDPSVKDITETREESLRLVRFNTSRTNSSAFLGHVTNISYEFAHILKHFIEKEGKPDLVEAQEYLGIAYYFLQYKYLLYDWCKDIPVLITMHSPSELYMTYNHVPMYRYPNFWICEMERFCLRSADQVISPSRYMIRELEQRASLENRNIEIVANPFDKKIIVAGGEGQAGIKEDEIVFYGKLTAQKGAFRLLRYFQELWDKGLSRPLFLLGGQDIVYHPEDRTMGDIIRKKYKKYIDQKLLRLEDRIKPAEIANKLSRAEVVIVPSDNDNLPYVVLEMMALGKVVLVSKQGGQSEIVENGIDGFVFDHTDPGTFFNQLETVLNLDAQQREKISDQARKKIDEGYSTGIVYKKKIRVIEAILGKRNQPSSKFPFLFSGRQNDDTNIEAGSFVPGRLSIVVPYYNMGLYIDETIASLANVDYRDKEILIINDGSSDELSIKKLDQYRHIIGIRVIDTVNGGLAKARNLGALQATGEYLAFLDADDTVHPGYYSNAIRVFRHYTNVQFAGCWVQYFGNSRNIWPAFTPEPPLILNHNMVNSSALVYKRAAFLAAGQNDPTMLFQGYEDYESVISMLSGGYGGVVFPEPLFNYRVRTNSMYRAVSRSKKLNLYQHISKKHQQFYASFVIDLFNLLNANGPGIVLDNPSLDLHLADKMPVGGKLSLQIIALMKKNRFVKTVAYKVYKMVKK